MVTKLNPVTRTQEMVPEAGEMHFAVRETREYEMARVEFAGAAMLHDPNEVNAFLMDHPFSVEALFVLSDICRQSGQHQDAFQLLRRAAYAMECSFHGSFSPFAETRLLIGSAERDAYATPQ